MMVPATLASMAMHCVQAHTRCMNKLSVKTEPLVRTFAMLAISPNASNRTDKLEASSNKYNIPVSSFSMVVNCFMGVSAFLGYLVGTVKDRSKNKQCFFVPASLGKIRGWTGQPLSALPKTCLKNGISTLA